MARWQGVGGGAFDTIGGNGPLLLSIGRDIGSFAALMDQKSQLATLAPIKPLAPLWPLK
jgi:hypothetical protein